MGEDFARLAITGEIKSIVAAVLASAIVDAEQNPDAPPAIDQAALLEVVEDALPKIEEQAQVQAA